LSNLAGITQTQFTAIVFLPASIDSFKTNGTFAAQFLNTIVNMLKNYETVFILNPVLSEQQVKDAVEKYTKMMEAAGAKIINLENMGLRTLAYPIQKKSSGFYTLIEFEAPTSFIKTLEIEYKRDERIMRFLTVALDKWGVEYNEKRRNGTLRSQQLVEA
jgi:small subunit ribosomal protein S6